MKILIQTSLLFTILFFCSCAMEQKDYSRDLEEFKGKEIWVSVELHIGSNNSSDAFQRAEKEVGVLEKVTKQGIYISRVLNERDNPQTNSNYAWIPHSRIISISTQK